MGLDQFAYKVKKGFIKEPVDFSTEQYNEERNSIIGGNIPIYRDG